MNGNVKKRTADTRNIEEKLSYVGKIDSNDDERREKSSCAFQKLFDAQGFNMDGMNANKKYTQC